MIHSVSPLLFTCNVGHITAVQQGCSYFLRRLSSHQAYETTGIDHFYAWDVLTEFASQQSCVFSNIVTRHQQNPATENDPRRSNSWVLSVKTKAELGNSAPCWIGASERPWVSGRVRHMRHVGVWSCHRSPAVVVGPLWALEISHAGGWPTFGTSDAENSKQEVVEKIEERGPREVEKYLRGKQNH